MRACKFHNVKKHCHRHAFVFKMDRNRHIRLVVGGCPCIGCEAQCPCVLLQWFIEGEFIIRNIYINNVLTCNIFVMRLQTLTNTTRVSREAVSAEGRR
ncbi:hypothetical protein K443DRAFT_506851 [Laccaria amethystina LaAM-08-1]|uniref:Uncharacterized protein n=1 Tax=Laccaria amethystina LaAM-08-1 TaxID=1095629 RepID=A0A0C9XN36_9AGAR|nr:hypothetical protein K443DRAFT_506851 [Laccaria amethystina LaAM-08-1]